MSINSDSLNASSTSLSTDWHSTQVGNSSSDPVLSAAVAALPSVGSSRISAIDRLFAKMPTLMIGGVVNFSSHVDMQTVKERFGYPLMNFPRFRQALGKDESNSWCWMEDPSFDFDSHFSEEDCNEQDVRASLMDSVNRLKNQGFDRNHPLWKLHLLHLSDGTSAMILLIHHSIADGPRFLQALNYIFDESSENSKLEASQVPNSEKDTKQAGGSARASFKCLSRAASKVQKTVRGGFHTGLAVGRTLSTPSQGASPIKEPNLKTGLSFDSMDQTFPLDEVKAIGRRLPSGRATVNDVMLALLSQALRRYFISQNVPEEELKGYRVSCGMPCSMRYDRPQNGVVPRLGNHVGGLNINLDLGIEDPLNQLRKVHKSMKSCKGSFQAELSNQTLKLLSLCPDSLVERGFHQMSKRMSVVVSNVPGPVTPWMLGDHEVSGVTCFLEGESDIGLGMIVFSYAGHIRVSFLIDPEVIKDQKGLKQCFIDAYQSYLEIGKEDIS